MIESINIIYIFMTAGISFLATEWLDIIIRILLTVLTVVGTLCAAIWGARAGVRLATSKELVEERAKAEIKQRIKIESSKEIIEAIKDIHFAINDAKYKISLALVSIIQGIENLEKKLMQAQKISLTDVQNLNTNDKRIDDDMVKIIVPIAMSVERGDNSIKEELKKIENLIFSLECDLRINSEDKTVKIKVNEIKNMHGKMTNALKIETRDKTIKEILGEVSKLFNEYSVSIKEGGDEEVKKILLELLDIYINRLN